MKMIIEDSKLINIADSIRTKSGTDEQMTVDEMPQRISEIQADSFSSSDNKNASLILVDWEGTILKSYSREEALALSALPKNSGVDHEMLIFQNWNWNIEDVKEFFQKHPNRQLTVGAIYTTTDGQNHYYFNNDKITDNNKCGVIKYGSTNIRSAFRNYYFLTNINIPDGVASADYCTFDSCYHLTHINIPSTAKNIVDSSFGNCWSLTSVSIPSSVTDIGYCALNYCHSLENITIPDSVTNLGQYAFGWCRSLTNVAIPDSVTSIGNGAFYECMSLKNTSIGNGVTSLGDSTFFNCVHLCDVILKDKISLLNSNAFYVGNAANPLVKFYVHQSDLDWYSTATNWSTYYTQGQFKTIEDNIDYLISLGYSRDELLGVSQ